MAPQHGPEHGGRPIAATTTEHAPPEGTTSPGPDPTGAHPAPGRRRRSTIVALLGGLVLGIVAAVIGAQVFGADDGQPNDVARIAPGEVSGPDDLVPDGVPVPDGAGASSAEAAAVGFLDAEVAGDFERSFGYLSDAERAEYGSPAGWVSAHADVVPPILGYELAEQTELAAGRSTVTVELRLRPGLDPVVGLTPAAAIVRLDAVEGAGGWGVSLQTSPFEPVHPSDEAVVPAAREWVAARQRCEPPDNERSGLVGSPALARALCDAEGDIDLGGPAPLDDRVGQPVFTAFGAEATAAARVVRTSGAVDLAIVLVPIGTEWIVIGILP